MDADNRGGAREQPAEEQVELAVEVFAMLADVTRVRVLWALLDAELAVNEVARAVGRAPAGVSQHLAKLRMARLVRTRKQGTQVFYRIENSHVRQLVRDVVFHVDHITNPGVPEHHRGDPDVAALHPGTVVAAGVNSAGSASSTQTGTW
jgi:DNA-binding transcriptional ArsR family regulator